MKKKVKQKSLKTNSPKKQNPNSPSDEEIDEQLLQLVKKDVRILMFAGSNEPLITAHGILQKQSFKGYVEKPYYIYIRGLSDVGSHQQVQIDFSARYVKKIKYNSIVLKWGLD